MGLRRIATGVFKMMLARLLGQGILAGDGLQHFFDFAGYSHLAILGLGLEVRRLFARMDRNFARRIESSG